ncbi:hypothetical protein CCHR01_19909 [Colletotrichum chrysophilum]|uniref:Uncharacterized protein n=1 Tax=Colletotrichum chrysophilum TaxID=1836956 RepID=A0AAD9E7F1_9PEZI|nr:hypothetical protein CCHR01_19909 [Colletotrichum chrysophilum]
MFSPPASTTPFSTHITSASAILSNPPRRS